MRASKLARAWKIAGVEDQEEMADRNGLAVVAAGQRIDREAMAHAGEGRAQDVDHGGEPGALVAEAGAAHRQHGCCCERIDRRRAVLVTATSGGSGVPVARRRKMRL